MPFQSQPYRGRMIVLARLMPGIYGCPDIELCKLGDLSLRHSKSRHGDMSGTGGLCGPYNPDRYSATTYALTAFNV